MTYVNLDDSQCDPGAFMDSLAPDVRAKAETVHATVPPKPTMAEAVAEVVVALRYARRLNDEARREIDAALAQWDAYMEDKTCATGEREASK